MQEAIHSLKIGTLTLKSNIVQAPLASYSSRSYRHLCALYGSPIGISEMVSAEGLLREGEKTLSLIKKAETESDTNSDKENIGDKIPYAIQLFASIPDSFKKAVRVLSKHLDVPLIDINAACPVQKVLRNGCGGALMNNPSLIKEIVKSIKGESGANVSVKIRLGMDNNNINYLECAEAAFEGGADAVSLHARTVKALYGGSADYSHPKNLKDHFKEKTILTSGDIFSHKIAKEVINLTGTDGVLAARGAIGNPFIFSDDENVKDADYISALKTHLRLHVMYGDTPLRDLRKFIPYYFKHLKHSKNIKDVKTTICCSASSYDDFINAINRITPENS